MNVTAHQYDWSSFTKRISVKAPVQALYTLCTTQAGMEAWFLRLAEYRLPNGTLRERDKPTQTGDMHKWLWHGWCDDVMESGTTLEANGKDFYKFSFGKAGNVSFRFYKELGETIVEVKQENIPTDEQGKVQYHVGCMEGWTFYLANLKSILEGGIDLRNKNQELHKVVNA
jgi:uncharacterized protein YndB with AHSA1/START domain